MGWLRSTSHNGLGGIGAMEAGQAQQDRFRFRFGEEEHEFPAGPSGVEEHELDEGP